MGNTSHLISAWGSAEALFAGRRKPWSFIHDVHSSSEVGGARAREGLPGACANAAPARGVVCCRTQAPRPAPLGVGPQSRKCAEWAVGCPGSGRRPARRGAARTGSPHVARHVAERLAPGALEPPASVAEAVSSLTIVDAFIAAGESPAPPPRALPGRFICSFPDCGANYNKAWKLDAHLCKHTGERPFICDHEGCGKAFVRDYHLSRHALIHTGEKPFACTASGCNQKFNTKSNLKKHFERKHENQQKQYVCSFEGCRKTFKKHQQLKIHQCQHTNEPLFRCTHEGCGKHFVSPSRLKRHGKVHEGYRCQKECSFVAKTWTELLKHVRETHKEEITCEVCQKTFKRKDYLKQHMKTHAPERDVCRCPREGCGRTYTTVFNLQSHILSFHEERRPFVCQHAGCGKALAMKDLLTYDVSNPSWCDTAESSFLCAVGHGKNCICTVFHEQSLTRHAIVHDPDKKKMKLKVKRGREKRSLASHLSGYIPPKRTQGQDLSLPKTRGLLDCAEDRVLSTAAALALS